MTHIAHALQEARSPAEVLLAAASLLSQDERNLAMFGRLDPKPRLATVDDLERCIGQVRVALSTLPMTDRDEERAHRLLGHLMLAGMRAQQLA